MKCPFCNSKELKVIDKRESDEDTERRRRECISCGKRFTTYERVEMIDLKIVKKDDRRESYNRDKILKGVIRSCEKRPISSEQVNKVVDEIEAEIFRMERSEIPSTDIGDIVMKHLKRLDDIAYIRFASVYRQFKDLNELEEELEKLSKHEKN